MSLKIKENWIFKLFQTSTFKVELLGAIGTIS